VLESFWSGVGDELARHWVARVLTPAFAFWLGGLVLAWWESNADTVATDGWLGALAVSAAALGELPVLVQGALLICALVLVSASAAVAERLTLPLLRLLEGYWTRPMSLRRLLVGYRVWCHQRVRRRATPLQQRQRRGSLSVAEFQELRRLRVTPESDQERLATLEKGAATGLSAQETTRLGRDIAWLRTSPDRDDLRMPTRLGDLLRAAEHRPAASYGLDAVVCWRALWLLLPAEIRAELIATRAALDVAVRAWLWGALFLLWAPVNGWAALVGFGVPMLTYRFGILPRAAAFGELIVTSFDLHRMKLYDALHLPRPASPAEERVTAGPRATRALTGTLIEPDLTYCFSEPR
jgi:hypothetical protein